MGIQGNIIPVGSLAIGGAIANVGVIETTGGKVTVDGAVTGTGTAMIARGVLNFASSFNQSVAFTRASGELALAQSRAYTANISGFSTSGRTSLDLRDIGFVGAGEATFSGTTSQGVLTVSDGTHAAHITLLGDYVGTTFTASSDGHGGLTVVDHAAGAQAFAAAMAGMGGGAGTTSSPSARSARAAARGRFAARAMGVRRRGRGSAPSRRRPSLRSPTEHEWGHTRLTPPWKWPARKGCVSLLPFPPTSIAWVSLARTNTTSRWL